MLESDFLSWMGIGFMLAAAVGPIWLLVAQRTLTKGWRYGLASGLGVAAADGVYGLLGAAGLHALALGLADANVWLSSAGSLVIAAIGVRILLSAGKVNFAPGQPETSQKNAHGSLVRAAISIFLLTLANPMTMISFAAIYTGTAEAGFGLNPSSVGQFAAAIFCGSLLWWAILVGAIAAGRRQIDPSHVLWINRAAGAAITLLGVGMVLGRLAQVLG